MKATDEEPIEGIYSRGIKTVREEFEADGDGLRAIAARSALLDRVLQRLWTAESAGHQESSQQIAIVAIGGYGRSQLFPCSDVDFLVCSEKPLDPKAKELVRRISQSIWDCGMRASPATRTIGECERFSVENAEFGYAILDRRFVTGNSAVFEKFNERIQSRMLNRDTKSMRAELALITRERHAKYGNTLFHLEPNIKECPGGLRDVHVCGWIDQLTHNADAIEDSELSSAFRFLTALRCFLHYRHERDDNTLDWQAQDAAAEKHIGFPPSSATATAAAWMRAYFRHARVIERNLHRVMEKNGLSTSRPAQTKRGKFPASQGYRFLDGHIVIDSAAAMDPATDPDTVLGAFAAMAQTGVRLTIESEERIAAALPLLALHLDDWPSLWAKLSAVLTERYAGAAMRSMHAIGLLELILPEFHGIDALVIRDAYHRYTVDEHTFVLIDVLHALESAVGGDAPEWEVKFGAIVREVHHSGALYLAALLHDIGKGRMSDDHAAESAHIARGVVGRLDLEPYEAELVLRLIETHLDMSSALRRDIFDAETVRAFAAKVQTHESLRMLAVFTYADIQAVHPDALTPWKAENLWRLFMRTANQLDRNVDDERIHTRGHDERVAQLLELLKPQKAQLELFLEGFPERYLQTRSKDVIIEQFLMSSRLAEEAFQVAYKYAPVMNEITLITQDKPRLFSNVAGALAAWGLNVVSAEAFANASGVVVDTFRFIDSYRTLELNESERVRFVASLRDMVAGRQSFETMLRGRRNRKKRAPKVSVETNVSFDTTVSQHSTLLQVIAQDTPGLLYAVSEALSNSGCNVEVALIDTEGEMAIDVFYLTHDGQQLEKEKQVELSEALRTAIEANAAQG